jgi:transcriptional regulator with XRE-family HTH domain
LSRKIQVPLDEWLAAIGDRVRQHRERRGWSQDRLGGLCGLTQGAVSMLERGRRAPALELLWRVAGALSIEVAVLVRGSRLRAGFDADALAELEKWLEAGRERPPGELLPGAL